MDNKYLAEFIAIGVYLLINISLIILVIYNCCKRHFSLAVIFVIIAIFINVLFSVRSEEIVAEADYKNTINTVYNSSE